YACLQNLFGDKVDAIYTMPVRPMKRETGAKITMQSLPGIEAEARWIYEKIQELEVKDISKIGILTRSNQYNHDLSECFFRFNRERKSEQVIEFMLVEQFKFFRRKEIKDVVACLKFLVNKYDINSLQRIIKCFAGGIGMRTLKIIKSPAYRKAGISLADFVDLQTYADGDPFKRLIDAKKCDSIIVLDVKSIGLDVSMDEIVQIAAIRLDAQGNVIETFERFLQPVKPVGTSEKIHGLSDAFLKKHGDVPTVVLLDCLQFSKNAIIVGHNINYDICVFRSQSERLGIDTKDFGKDAYDTLDLFRRFYPNLVSYKLSFLRAYFKIEKTATYNALNNVVDIGKLLAYICKKNIEPLTAQRRIYIKKYIGQFKELACVMQKLVEEYSGLRPYTLVGEVVNKLHIKEYYEKKKQEVRIKRLREFYLLAKELDDVRTSNHTALLDLLKVTALSNSELDRIVAKWPRIPIITVHQAKGTEFEYEFLAGLAEGVFPTWQALRKDDLEEEKRLFYVAITRAKHRLYLSWSRNYKCKKLLKSRFLDAIPVEFMMEEKTLE
ncbi:MAG: 3'-5' exonuclease, partial [Selenomonadaceae bacterium]